MRHVRVSAWTAPWLAAWLAVWMAAAPAGAQGLPGPPARAAAAAAWDALDEGRNADAADLFDEAIALEPRDPALRYGAGAARFFLGQVGEARARLTEALAMAPAFTNASLLLGDILYRDGDAAGALAVYEAALAETPGHADLTERAAGVQRELDLQRDFFQSPGAHYTVLFEGPADEALARQALEILEGAYFRIAAELAVFPDRVVPVVLYTEEQFRDVTQSPDWAAASYDGRIRVPMRGALDQPAELERVLVHEAAHAFIRTIAPRGVPTWLNEGLATTFEPGGDARAAAELARTDERLPLDRLAGGFGGLSGSESRVAYAQSAAAARMLLDVAGPAGVVAILRDIAAGDTFAAAFERRALLSYEWFTAQVAPGS